MHLIEAFKIAFGMLWLHKMRAVLTMLGVIIGVMSVTSVVMLSEGFKVFIRGQFDQLSADSIFLFYDPSGLPRGQTTTISAITEDDREFLLERSRHVEFISAVGGAPSQRVQYQTREARDTNVTPTDQYYFDIVRHQIISGRVLEAEDIEQKRNVAVITEAVATLLFPDGEAVGRWINMPSISLQVVGVVENLRQGTFGNNNPRLIYMPITTAQFKWTGGRNYGALFLRPREGSSVEETQEEIWQLMMIRSNNLPIYRVDSSEGILNVFQGVIGGAGTILAAIAALSLLVGGIGIMNIMLVSVTERTKEIGLRKAVGANRFNILSQFLIESATLSMVGGAIGMAIAFGIGRMISLFTAARAIPVEGGLSAPFPMTAAIGALAFSAIIGVIFGFFPAVRAARLHPIEAMRYE